LFEEVEIIFGGSTDYTKDDGTESNESTRSANLTDFLGPEDDAVELWDK